MRSLLTFVLAPAMAIAQSAQVANNADTGAGSLRAAITAANASPSSTFTIDVTVAATAAPIVLATTLPPLTRSNATIRALAGAGRLTIDARGPTSGGSHGLDLNANGIRLLARCRVLVMQGNGVLVRGTGIEIADLEAVGSVGGSGVVAVAGADGLKVSRLVADTFQIGLHLLQNDNARIADDGVSNVEARNCNGPGIQITNGNGHRIGTFVCTNDALGISASGSNNLQLGSAAGPRSWISASGQQGLLLLQCTGVTVQRVDLVGNGIGSGGSGIQVVGGARVALTDLTSIANVQGGIVLGGGLANVRIGPAVVTRGLSGGLTDIGIGIRNASSVAVVDTTFGPGHRAGVQLVPENNVSPSNVSLCNCTITGNGTRGLMFSSSNDTLLCSSTVTANINAGIEATGLTPATAPRRLVVSNCRVVANAGHGALFQNVDALRFGPGNRLDDNLVSGLRLYGCANPLIDEAPSITGNRSNGLWMNDCDGARVVRCVMRGNRDSGLYAGFCTDAEVGPGVVIADTLGSGVQFEECDGCRITSSRITASSAHGVHLYTPVGTPGTIPHVLRSCLIADNPGLAIAYTGGPPVRCELSTITGNLRGIDSGNNPMTVDSCIVYGNLLEDVQQSATALTVRHTIHRLPAPAPGSTNANVDPRFVSTAAKDWRLQATSPAIGFADPALPIPPGSQDAYDGARAVGAVDAGSYEVGPHPAPPARLTLGSATMPRGGGGMAYRAQYPISAAGSLSILLLEFGPASGSFPIFGGTIPLGLTPSLLLAADDRESFGTIALVDAGGAAEGALLWVGRLSPSVQNQIVSLCAVALDPTLFVRSVSNVATFTIL